MKLLIAKDITGIDVTEDYLNDFLDKISSSFQSHIVLFDGSLKEQYEDFQFPESVQYVKVPYEDRDRINLMGLNAAAVNGCVACLFFPQNAYPKTGIVEKLFSEMADENISATFCDYTENDILMVQNTPVVICRRVEENNGDMFNLQACKGIVKYIPMDLYNVSG
jgi:hypothetical protein